MWLRKQLVGIVVGIIIGLITMLGVLYTYGRWMVVETSLGNLSQRVGNIEKYLSENPITVIEPSPTPGKK